MMNVNNRIRYKNSQASIAEIDSKLGMKTKKTVITVESKKNESNKRLLHLPIPRSHSFTEFLKLNYNKNNKELKVTSDNVTSSFFTDHTYCSNKFKIVEQSNDNLAINNDTQSLNTESASEAMKENFIFRENSCVVESSLKGVGADVDAEVSAVNESNFIYQLYCDEIIEEVDGTNELIIDNTITDMDSQNYFEESSSICIQTEVNNVNSQGIEKNSSQLDQKQSPKDDKVNYVNFENTIGEKLSKINQLELIEDDKFNNANLQDSIEQNFPELNQKNSTEDDKADFINSENTIGEKSSQINQQELIEDNKLNNANLPDGVERNSPELNQEKSTEDDKVVFINFENTIGEKLSQLDQQKLIEDDKLNNTNLQNSIGKNFPKRNQKKLTKTTKVSKLNSQNIIGKNLLKLHGKKFIKDDTVNNINSQNSIVKISSTGIQTLNLKRDLAETANTSTINLSTVNTSTGLVSKNNDTKVFNCGICKKNLDTLELFDKHVACHAHIKYKCKHCNISFLNDYQELEKHFIDFHMGKISEKSMEVKSNESNHLKPDPKVIKSTKLQSNQQTEIHALKNPFGVTKKERHCSEGQYTCPVCSCKLKYKNGFKRHKKNHDDFLSTYRCFSTSSTFSNRNELKIHINNCFVCRQLFKCNICQEICTDKLHFFHHSKSHKQSYICHDCGQAFTTKTLLQLHLNDYHVSEKNLFCSACHQDFDTINLLIQHMKNVHKKHFMQWMTAE